MPREKLKAKKARVKREKYWESIGRRKTATASVRLKKGDSQILVNNKEISEYFENPDKALKIIISPLELCGKLGQFNISIKVKGGGKKAQMEAIRLGVARALILFDQKMRPTLKKVGFLTRDPREKERKKPGLKRARRAPQWQKR